MNQAEKTTDTTVAPSTSAPTHGYSLETIHKCFKTNFGYDRFRPNQLEIIHSVLEGKDTIAIMPTGGGKSICFQLPALLLPGLTIVVSPLIALMKDQVDGLRANGISASFINSTQSQHDFQMTMDKIAAGKLKLLYIAPESFDFIQDVLRHSEISLIAIDEAHCISSWGHDFRPAYTKLGFLKDILPRTPVLALTATADRATRKDIMSQLRLVTPKRFISSFDRPNLYLEVRPGQKRNEQIVSFIKGKPQESGIVYCLSRKSTVKLAATLQKKGIEAKAYHAGLSAETRSNTQEDFLNDNIQVICATIAFGMGIDKSNVRWVIHYNLPKNIEGYYQEIGRAGRDGLVSDTLLFYSYADVVMLQKFASDSANADFQLAKLDRMQQFAESLNCRRRALLAYFGEILGTDCGNCDNCKHPPKLFDGTVIAQKAMSAITRLKAQEQTNNIIDFLRGSSNSYMSSKGYPSLRTYGIGKDISWTDWQQYLVQLLNQGVCEIDFQDGNKLKLNALSRRVLFEGQKITLAYNVERKKLEKGKKTKRNVTPDEALFQLLREVRSGIAKEEGVPAYIIFSDAALRSMSDIKPNNGTEFLDVEGVGTVKLQRYGKDFIEVIKEFVASPSKKKKTKKGKGATYEETLKLFSEGFSVDEIAIARKLSANTILTHLTKLHSEGKDVKLEDLVSSEIVEKVRKAKAEITEPGLKPYFSYFNEEISYDHLRLALTIISK